MVGSANADLVVGLRRRPGPGETVLGDDLRLIAGGKGANQAVAAARLGADVRFIGAVGADAHGDLVRAGLVQAGVELSGLRTVERPTGTAMITVTPDAENAIVVSPGANAEVGVQEIHALEESLAHAAVVLTCLEIPRPAVEAAAAVTRRAGVRFAINLSPVVELGPATLALADPLIVNQHEAAALLGADAGRGPRRMARELLDSGPTSVVITTGAEGAVVACSDAALSVPARPVRPVDTTGAGDAFAGALVSRLALGVGLVEAARFAVRVAAVSVTRVGAQPSFPTMAELDPPIEGVGA